MPLNESKFGGGRGEKKKQETYNAVLRQHRWMANVNTSFFLEGNQIQTSGWQQRVRLARQQDGSTANNHSLNLLSSHTETSNLEHLSEINILELTQKPQIGWICLSYKHYYNLFIFPGSFLCKGTSFLPSNTSPSAIMLIFVASQADSTKVSVEKNPTLWALRRTNLP